MANTIFWSWQSDEPQRETRDLMREALKDAIDQIGAELEEADRPKLDHDTKGEPGSPEIVNTILRKIETASLFIADVTPIAVTRGGKQIPNPNVMLELGYARKVLGLDRIILVWNMALFDSTFADLPFDLHGLGKSCGYKLAEKADKNAYRKARADLTQRLKDRIEETLLPQASLPSLPEPEWHASLPHDPSIWAEAYNPLRVIIKHKGNVDLIVKQAPRFYARLLPTRQTNPVLPSDGFFPSAQSQLKTIDAHGRAELNMGQTSDGRLICERISEDRTTMSVARWYKDNGEIWAISGWSFYTREANTHFAYDEAIKHLARWLGEAVQASLELGGTGPFKLRLGAVGLTQVFWWRGISSPTSSLVFGLNPVVQIETVLQDENQTGILAAIGQFMDDMTDNYGVPPLRASAIETLAAEDSSPASTL